MAAAELEMGRDAARSLGSTSLIAGLSAFLAHLWLRREQIETAEGLENEALQQIQGTTNEKGTSSRGMVLLVNAEIQAVRSNWETSHELFQESLKAFHYSRLGRYFEAFAHACYGETLMRLKKVDGGCRYLAQARSMFKELSNESQVERANRVMAGDAICSCDK